MKEGEWAYSVHKTRTEFAVGIFGSDEALGFGFLSSANQTTKGGGGDQTYE